nr:MAG TPA: hypothetical protein [Bacteriophage sp.]
MRDRANLNKKQLYGLNLDQKNLNFQSTLKGKIS